MWPSRPGNGVPTWVLMGWKKASTSASLPGNGWRPTPSLRWPRPAATICPVPWSAWKRESRGFAEGIALSTDGTVSEGAGENLFLVRDGVILTPPAAASILTGITRDAVITLAAELGLRVRRTFMPREMLYIADEMFLTGTAAEITPVRSVDRIEIGNGAPRRNYPALAGGLFRAVQRCKRKINGAGWIR